MRAVHDRIVDDEEEDDDEDQLVTGPRSDPSPSHTNNAQAKVPQCLRQRLEPGLERTRLQYLARALWRGIEFEECMKPYLEHVAPRLPGPSRKQANLVVGYVCFHLYLVYAIFFAFVKMLLDYKRSSLVIAAIIVPLREIIEYQLSCLFLLLSHYIDVFLGQIDAIFGPPYRKVCDVFNKLLRRRPRVVIRFEQPEEDEPSDTTSTGSRLSAGDSDNEESTTMTYKLTKNTPMHHDHANTAKVSESDFFGEDNIDTISTECDSGLDDLNLSVSDINEWSGESYVEPCEDYEETYDDDVIEHNAIQENRTNDDVNEEEDLNEKLRVNVDNNSRDWDGVVPRSIDNAASTNKNHLKLE